MNPLESRRRLLIAESELNRAQLGRDWDAMTVGVRTFTGRVKSFGSIASVGALLVTGLAAFRRGKGADADVKPSWRQAILKGMGLVSTLWLAIRAKRHRENKDPKSRA